MESIYFIYAWKQVFILALHTCVQIIQMMKIYAMVAISFA